MAQSSSALKSIDTQEPVDQVARNLAKFDDLDFNRFSFALKHLKMA